MSEKKTIQEFKTVAMSDSQQQRQKTDAHQEKADFLKVKLTIYRMNERSLSAGYLSQADIS